MDVLRSAHATNARVGSDNLTESKIRWYKCKPGAKAFPGFHAFGSPVWEPHPDEWTQGPGVFAEPLTWTPKDIQAPPGTEFHGLKEWYERGIPQAVFDKPLPFKREPCIPPPLGLGVVAGMTVALSPVGPEMECVGCEVAPHVPLPLPLTVGALSGLFLTSPSLAPPAPVESDRSIDGFGVLIISYSNTLWTYGAQVGCRLDSIPGISLSLYIDPSYSGMNSVDIDVHNGWIVQYDGTGGTSIILRHNFECQELSGREVQLAAVVTYTYAGDSGTVEFWF